MRTRPSPPWCKPSTPVAATWPSPRWDEVPSAPGRRPTQSASRVVMPAASPPENPASGGAHHREEKRLDERRIRQTVSVPEATQILARLRASTTQQPAGAAPARNREVIELYRAGAAIRTVAAVVGCAHGTAHSILQKAGERRPFGRPAEMVDA